MTTRFSSTMSSAAHCQPNKGLGRAVALFAFEQMYLFIGEKVCSTPLTPHLHKRAEVLAERAKKKLTARGQNEAEEMKKILEEQRDRILKTKQETEQPLQLSLLNGIEVVLWEHPIF